MSRISLRALADLDDDDHVKALGDDTWHTVRELRTQQQQQDQEDHMNDDYTPTADPYRDDLAKLRAASPPALSTFEEAYKAARLTDLEETRKALDAEDLKPARLTAAELSEYTPPNGYAAALKRGV